ncbi:MAG: ABC transporter ATP-binding protein [Deltaproteobacteria bacterium]|nr:ABC transporter ATP-binding protein [Deltaproteobacteria bacterium]
MNQTDVRIADVPGPRWPPLAAFSPEPLGQPTSQPSQNLNPAVTLVNVSKSFGGRTVLQPINLTILEGQKAVLLGPSGCGKTTTLRLIAGLETAEPGGRILLGQRDVTRVPVEKREISMMFQNYALFPNLNVFDNVAYGLKIRKIPRAERESRVRELLAMTRLANYADRGVSALSGGQKQRVALARALATRPRVLLLDEPLGALDAALRVSVREEMDELLSGLGMTTVIVTHDQDEAMSLGDVIVVMREGRLEQVGGPREIFHEPASAFVAGFVGGSNRLLARVAGDYLLLPGDIALPLSAIKGDGIEAGIIGPRAFACPVSVYFRPDKPRLAEIAPGRMSGKVVSSRFVGGVTRLVVALEGGQRLKMELPGSAHVPSGSTVGVELPLDELKIFPETAALAS